MRVRPAEELQTYHLTPMKKHSIHRNNVDFNGTDRYKIALELFEQNKIIEKKKEELENLRIEADEAKGLMKKRIAAITEELAQEQKSFEEKEKEYEKFNPSKYDFIEDVKKGRTERMINTEIDNDGYDSINDTMGIPVGDWSFYCP